MEYQMYKSIQQSGILLKECLSEEISKRIKEIALKVVQKGITRVISAGCGTSLMISTLCEQFFGKYTKLDVYSNSAFEILKYPSIRFSERDLLLGFSHSGGTKALIDLVEYANTQGSYTVGISEVKKSRLIEKCQDGLIGPGGKDSATPKTRSYLTEAFMACKLALEIGKLQGMEVDDSLQELSKIPEMVQQTLIEAEPQIIRLREKLKECSKYIFVGSGSNFVTAKEGSLKMLETACINSTGIQIEEIAHGNELYLNNDYTVFFIYPVECVAKDRLNMIIDATRETGAVIAYITNCEEITDENSIVLSSKCSELLSAFIFVVPIQLFAYFSSVEKGMNPDLSTGIEERMKKAIAKYHPAGYH